MQSIRKRWRKDVTVRSFFPPPADRIIKKKSLQQNAAKRQSKANQKWKGVTTCIVITLTGIFSTGNIVQLLFNKGVATGWKNDNDWWTMKKTRTLNFKLILFSFLGYWKKNPSAMNPYLLSYDILGTVSPKTRKSNIGKEIFIFSEIIPNTKNPREEM